MSSIEPVDVDKWILKTSSETCDNDTSSIWSFISEWYAPTCVDHTQQKRKFLLLLQWFIGNTIHENHYVRYTKAMGLGLYATYDITIDELSISLAGFLEFIDETMFDILNILGYNSMYAFKDHSATKKRQRLCILYGPLSLVNASEEAKKIGFANSNPNHNDKLLYCEFVYVFKASYKTISSKQKEYYNTTIQVDDYDASVERVYKNTIKTEWDNCRLPVWPQEKSKEEERKLIPRVSISWSGCEGDFANSARTVKKDNQIFIGYKWEKRKVFYKLTDYKHEKLFQRKIEHLVEDDAEYNDIDYIEEEEEEPDNADDDYNENEDDDNGNDDNNDYFLMILIKNIL